MQILMSVLVVMIIALIMLTVLTLMVATTVHVIWDILEMASTAQVCYLELRATYKPYTSLAHKNVLEVKEGCLLLLTLGTHAQRGLQ